MDGQTTMIKIATVTRQTKESKMGTGPYTLTEITDAKTGLKAATFGVWSEGWKEGDEVEVKWTKNSWQDRNGNTQESWKLVNPNAKPSGPRGPQAAGASENLIIAAALVGPQYASTTLTPAVAKEAAEKIRKVAASLEEQSAPAPVAPIAPAPVYVPPAPVAPAPVYAPPAPVEQTYVPPAAVVSPVATAPEQFEEDNKPF